MTAKKLLVPGALGLALVLTACSGGSASDTEGAAASSAAAPSTAASPLEGVWSLQELTASGDPVPYAGQIAFSAGVVSVQASNPDPAAPDSAYTVQGYEAFYGDVTVDEDAGTFSVVVESAVARDLVGQTLTRNFEVTDDQLVLTPVDASEGWRVTYDRVNG